MIRLKVLLTETTAADVIDADFISYIKSVEGKKVNSKGLHYAYRDDARVLTIGYGHTGKDVTSGMTIDEAKAEQLLKTDLQTAFSNAKRIIDQDTRFTNKQKQNLSALEWKIFTDFAFNLGPTGLEKFPNFRKAILTKNVELAEREYERKAKVNGVMQPIGRNAIFKERLLDPWIQQVTSNKAMEPVPAKKKTNTFYSQSSMNKWFGTKK